MKKPLETDSRRWTGLGRDPMPDPLPAETMFRFERHILPPWVRRAAFWALPALPLYAVFDTQLHGSPLVTIAAFGLLLLAAVWGMSALRRPVIMRGVLRLSRSGVALDTVERLGLTAEERPVHRAGEWGSVTVRRLTTLPGADDAVLVDLPDHAAISIECGAWQGEPSAVFAHVGAYAAAGTP